MYKVCIADDEEIIRNGLAKHFDWNSIGFEVVGQFEDGQDTISFLEHNRVDAILTDVKMYKVSGIELARYVSEHCPQVKVVILSGYKEFEYARESMKYGVCDYVLKPVDMEEIRAVFLRVRDILENGRRNLETAPTLPFSYCDGQEYREILACGSSLVAVVVSGDSSAVYACHEKWFALLEGAPSEFVFFIVSNLFEELYIRFNLMGIPLDGSLQKTEVLKKLSYTGIRELFAETGNVFLGFCGYLSDKKENAREGSIIRAKKYIEEHLSENFSIEDVAKSIFLSRSYFSREFSHFTGENVIEYVIKRRMNRAIELLKQERYNVGEISTRVGYRDSKYFHLSFKKYTGYTVKEYQKLIQRTSR